MNNPDCSIIIVNYNAGEMLIRCIESLRQHTTGITMEIIVADNASSDGSTSMLKTAFPDVILLESPENEGYARAINRALEHAGGTYFIIMNPDTEVTYNLVNTMIGELRKMSGIGVAGCIQVLPDGSPRRSYFAFPSLKGRFAHLTGISRLVNIETSGRSTSAMAIIDVPVVCGSFMVMRRETLLSIGGFDSDYFLYHEEADLCRRMQANGLRNIIFTKHSIIHFGDHPESTENPVVFFHRNRSLLIYFYKHRSALSLWFLVKMNLLFYSIKYLGLLLPLGNRTQRGRKRRAILDVIRYNVRFSAMIALRRDQQIP